MSKKPWYRDSSERGDDYDHVIRLFWGTVAVFFGLTGGVGAWMRSVGDPLWLRVLYVGGSALFVLAGAWVLLVWTQAFPEPFWQKWKRDPQDGS